MVNLSSSSSSTSSTSTSASLPSTTTATSTPKKPASLKNKLTTSLALVLSLGFLFLVFVTHISVGAKSIPFKTVVDALFNYNTDLFDHMVVREFRMPRAIIALVVGSTLSVAGVMTQGITRNPLAEPGILGLQLGASLAVVIIVTLFGINDSAYFPYFAAVGALLASLLVWWVATSTREGASPLTLILSGAAITAFLGAVISALSLTHPDDFEFLRVWLTGTLAHKDLTILYYGAPFMLVGVIVALISAAPMNTFAMGEETATGLGVKVERLKVLTLISVVVLTAGSVAIAGPLGFIGLVIPHATRLLVGYDYRKIIPFSLIIGASYLLIADIVARLALAPLEISTGIVTSFVGAPLFIWLVRAKL